MVIEKVYIVKKIICAWYVKINKYLMRIKKKKENVIKIR